MSDSDKQLDQDAKRAITRIERQMGQEGRLRKADAIEGAAYLSVLALILFFAVIAGLRQLIHTAGANLIVGGILIVVGLGLLLWSVVPRK